MPAIPLNTFLFGLLILGVLFAILWVIGFFVHNRAKPTDDNVWVMPGMLALLFGRTEDPPIVRNGFGMLQPVFFAFGVTVVLRWMNILPEDSSDLWMVLIVLIFVAPIWLVVGKFRKERSAARSMDYFPNNDLTADGIAVPALAATPPLPFDVPVIPSRRLVYLIPVLIFGIAAFALFWPLIKGFGNRPGSWVSFPLIILFLLIILSGNINRALAGPLTLDTQGVTFRSLFGRRIVSWDEMEMPDIMDREIHLLRKGDKVGHFFRNVALLLLQLYVPNRYTMHAWDHDPVLVTLRKRIPGLEEQVQKFIAPDDVLTPQAPG